MTETSYVTTKQFDKFIEEETRHHELTELSAAKRGEQLTMALNQLDSINRWRAIVDEKLTKHHGELYGNGKVGIDEHLRQILEYVNEQKEKQKQAWSDTKKFALGVVAFVVNTLLAMLIAKLIP